MALSTLPPGLTAGTWQIDPGHSQADFTVRHAHVAKVRGSVRIVKGTIKVGETLEQSSVEAELDPAGVSTGLPSRDDHLRSPDFFDTESFPVWSFNSTAVGLAVPDTKHDDEWVFPVTGDLTIHGQTRSVVLEALYSGVAEDANGTVRAGISAHATIKRSDFGVTWSMPIPGGKKLVSDEVEVNLLVSATREG